ncbi:F0F1 ATP synthase subunit B [Amnibacterium endophyticum]|uniref:ATP synthase subunit b n=1 Tax=Amnibacterium endophyticum TaxID=2109337 RepID=A0ABW4LGU9_9MICO
MGGVILMAAEPSGGQTSLGPLFPELYDVVWSLVIFIVIAIVVWKVGLPRMNALLDARSSAIQGNIAKAEAAQREADEALERYNAQLAEARVEAGRIREQARDDAKRIVAEARQQAQSEADRIVAQGNTQVEASRAKAQSELRQEVGSLALDLASGVIGQHLAKDENATAYVDRFLADLETERAGTGR